MRTTMWTLMSLFGVAASELLFSDGFTNDMVLQHGANTAVYGLKDPGVSVSATLGGVSLDVETTDTEWRANIKPTAIGGDYSIKVTDSNSNTISIERVTFGNVFFCSGQSNMQLPLHFTFETKYLTKEVLGGAYSNIRFFNHPNGKQQMYEPQYVSTQGNTSWYNVTYSAGLPDAKTFEFETDNGLKKVQLNPFHGFSATCMHFAMSLIDRTGDKTTPIGLILSAVGGTMIESWISNSTYATCRNLSTGPPTGNLYRAMVAPFVNTSITGFLWYQGENNCGGFMGNSADGTGYGCAQVALVKSWREIWSVREGTTPSDAPFGVVSLAAGGSEGHQYNMARMRWAQTGNYGHLPNPAMPRTFMAQGYDIGDPWAQKGPGQNNCTHPDASGKYGPDCLPWGAADFPPPLQVIEPFIKNPNTSFYMGPIHPRIKLPVGRRLAEAYYNQFLDGTGALTGPTISGCSTSASAVTVKFNTTLLKNSKLAVNTGYNYTGFTDSNTMLICTGARGGNETTCNCLGWGSVTDNSTGHPKAIYFCSDGPGWKPAPGTPFLTEREMAGLGQRNPHVDIWQPAPLIPDTESTVKIDLSRVNTTGGIFAIKYGWANGADTCCSGDSFNYEPCFPAHCPITDTNTWFPANPFFAAIKNGKCECLPPQVCDE